MPEPRLPLTPAERADLRQKAEQTLLEVERVEWYGNTLEASGAYADYIVVIPPLRLLALLDEVERLEDENAGLRLHRPNRGTSND